MIRLGLAHKFAKYKILGFLHAAKANKIALHRMMGIGASFMQDRIKEEDTAKFKLIYRGLQFFDDNLLEQYAENISTSLIENRGYYALLFMAGILKI
jgi:hypothetical protein